MNALQRLLRRRSRLAIAPFGGDIRPPVMGPTQIQGQLARLAAARTFLTAIVTVLALVNLGFAIRTPGIMGTELFVSDGSAFGCHVPSFPAD